MANSLPNRRNIRVSIGRSTSIKIAQNSDTYSNFKSINLFRFFEKSPKLIKSQPLLREATVNGFYVCNLFNLWSTLIFFVSSPAYYWGPKEVGILAIFGLSGAFVAPIIGRLSDYYPERKIVLIGLLMQFGSFILLF